MVIACPSCSRKYQIDTTRIPAGGTSFTCWSCRTPVHVAAGSGPAAEEPGPAVTAAAVEPIAESSGDAGAQPGSPGGSSVPPAAMRFFESLAAEATLKRAMPAVGSGGPAARPDERDPGAAEAPLPEPPAETAPFGVSEAPESVEPPAVARTTVDLLHGDNVLDLPDVRVVPGAATADIIDVGGGGDEPVEPARETAEIGSSSADEAKRPTTAEIASEPADEVAAEPATTRRTTGEIASPPSPPAEETPQRPTLALASTQAVEPSGAGEPPAQAERNVGLDAPLPPASPELAPAPPEPIAPRVRPARPAIVSPAAADASPEPKPLSPPTQPVEPIPAAQPQAAALFAAHEAPAAAALPERPAAWVAPEVDTRVEAPKGRPWLGALAAVVVVAAFLGIAWWFLGGTAGPRSAATEASRAPEARSGQEAAPPATAPAQEPGGDPSPASAPAAGPGPLASDSASPAFTIQLRSSPSEDDSRAFADSLKASGFDAYVASADLGSRGTWYRVRVGRFATRAEAHRQVAALRASGHGRDAIVVAESAP